MAHEEPPSFEELYEHDVLDRIDAVLAEHLPELGPTDATKRSEPTVEPVAGELVQVDFAPDASADPVGTDVDRVGASASSRDPVSIDGRLAAWARGTIAGGFLFGTGRAIEELFKADPEIAEIVEDPGFGNEDTRPVRLVLVPGAPKQSKAFVRPWLFGRVGGGGRQAANDRPASGEPD